MSFSSTMYRDELVIDDSTPDYETDAPDGYTHSLKLDFRGPGTYEYGDLASPFPQDLLLPRHEWQARIQEMEERKTRISDVVTLAGLPCKDQGQTNYCWINAPVHLIEVIRVLQGQEPVSLSPASAGAPIKSYRNVGGWGKEGLEYLVQYGCVPVEKWPANAIDRRYNTAENRELALKYRVVEWWELRPRNLDEVMSCLLRRIPIAVGYNWWRHEVSLYDPVWVNGQPGGRLRNSWGMSWPKPLAGGYSILQGSRLLPDDAVCPLTAIAA